MLLLLIHYLQTISYDNKLLRCMTVVVEGVASGEHQVLAFNSRDTKILVGFEDFCGLNHIGIDGSVWHCDRDYVAIGHIL